jgi:hypothetical protein
MAQSLAENLFGRVNFVEEYLPQREDLEAGFQNRKTATQAFCQFCGAYWEVNIKKARELAQLAEINLPRHDLSAYYFETSGCEDCLGRETWAILKKIKDLPKPIKKPTF